MDRGALQCPALQTSEGVLEMAWSVVSQKEAVRPRTRITIALPATMCAVLYDLASVVRVL